jgi:hypothetical protein
MIPLLGLDPYIRCNGCGRAVDSESQQVCGFCRGKLAEIGTKNGYLEWQEQRKHGKWRFALWRTLFQGMVGTIGWSIVGLLKESVAFAVIQSIAWFVVSFFLSYVAWVLFDRQYRAWAKENGIKS